jgi:hypothetical protein
VVALQGIISRDIETVPFKTMSKWTMKEGEVLLVEVQPMLNNVTVVQVPKELCTCTGAAGHFCRVV